jgi:hypothetical protein
MSVEIQMFEVGEVYSVYGKMSQSIQDVPGGIVNILGGSSMDYSE